MPLTKCIRCVKLFNKIDSPLCQDCIPLEEDDFETIRAYVNLNEHKNANEVSEATNVDIKCVLRMIDNGNIATVSNSESSGPISCGQCGAPALSSTQKLCQKCLDKLNFKMMATRQNLMMGQKKDEGSSTRDMLQEKRKHK